MLLARATERNMLLVARQCPAGRGCSTWIHKYLHDCVCSVRDAVSFSFGLVSVISWGIAEVPQIITNFKEKSTEGVSLLFLMTWVVGDFFNLAGCFLEPATLPTQFYMALLYTATTLILVGQTIHYGRRKQPPEKEPLLPSVKHPSSQPQQPTTTGSEVPATSGVVITALTVPSPQRRKFYTSARSLASSHTPTAGSVLSSSSVRGVSYMGSQTMPSTMETCQSQPINIVRAVTTGVLMFGSVSLCSRHYYAEDKAEEFVTFGVRRLLQEPEEHSRIGEMCGWIMAAIYMGGRFPQIWLNMTRGTVEGLNPMMFMFALIGNATYVASILVRSIAWKRLKPNLPWLVDAAACVLLDFFIMIQFCYYCFIKKGRNQDNDQESK